ncbi:MAG: hypothetical protein ACXVPU_18905 [Bacteroidia bacterium]
MKPYLSVITIFVFKLIVFSDCFLNAQIAYQSKPGDVIITASYNNENFSGESKDVVSNINYESSEVRFSLDPTTITTKADTFNVCFKSDVADQLNECIKGADIQTSTLAGKSNVDFTNRDVSSESSLKFEAEFQLNGITKLVYVTGTLKPLSSSDIISSILTLDFFFRLTDFGITPPAGFSDLLQAEIIQTVLSDEKK